MITSLSLTILISRVGGSSVIREGAQQQNQSQPAPAEQQPPAQSTPVPPATPENK